MSCNYFKLFLFSILLCILIITHKFSRENVHYNKKHTDYGINTGYKRLLAESQETDIFKNHSSQNSVTYPMYNILDEHYTEYHKNPSSFALNNEIHQEPDSQKEQMESEKDDNNNKSMFQKSHKKSHFTKKLIIALIVYLTFFAY